MDRRTFLVAGGAATAMAGSAQAAQEKTVWLIRHGESTGNVRPDPTIPDSGMTYPLTHTGLLQAKAVAEQLRGVELAGLISSTRLRAIQTADAIAFVTEAAVELAPELVEINRAAAESVEMLRARVVPAVRAAIAARSIPGKRLILVSHGGAIAFSAPFLFTNVTQEFVSAHPLPNAGVVKGVVTSTGLLCTEWAGLQLP